MIYQDNGDGTATATGVAVKSDGTKVRATVSNPNPVSLQSVAKAGLPISQKQSVAMANDNSVSRGTMGLAQEANRITSYQSVRGSIGGTGAQAQNIVINALLTPALTSTVFIGDPANIAALQTGAAALPGTTTIGGTFGTATVATLKALIGSNNGTLVVSKVTVQATATGGVAAPAALLGNNLMSIVQINADGTTNSSNVSFSSLITPDQFNPSIQVTDPSFRCVLDSWFSLRFIVPAVTNLSITLTIEAIGGTSDVVLC